MKYYNDSQGTYLEYPNFFTDYHLKYDAKNWKCMTVVRLPQLSLQWLPIACDARRLFAFYACEFNHTTPQKFYENVADIYALTPSMEQCEGKGTFVGKPIIMSTKDVCLQLLPTGSSMNTSSSHHYDDAGTFENLTLHV